MALHLPYSFRNPGQPSFLKSPLNKRLLLVAQGGWLALAALALLLNGIGIPLHFSRLQQGNKDLQTFFQLSVSVRTFLLQNHISLTLYAGYILAIEILFTATLSTTAVLIFWRKRHEWMALFTSLTIMAFGTGITGLTQELKLPTSSWHWAASFLQTVATICCLILFYLFPTGRWVPRWTRVCAGTWIALNLLWFMFPDLPFNIIYVQTWSRTSVLSFIFACLWFSTGALAQVIRYQHTHDRTRKLQAGWIKFTLIMAIVGAAMFYCPPILALTPFLPAHTIGQTDPSLFVLYKCISIPLAGILVALAPVSIGASLLSNRPWNTDILNRLFRYGITASVLIWLYFVCVILLQTFFFQSSVAPSWFLLLTGLVVPFFWLGNRLLQGVVNHHFNPKILLTRRLQKFTHDLSLVTVLPRLLSRLANHAGRLLHSKYSIVYLLTHEGAFHPEAAYNLALNTLPPLRLQPEEIASLTTFTPLMRPDSIFTLLLPLIEPLPGGKDSLRGLLVLGPPPGRRWRYTSEEKKMLLELAKEGGQTLVRIQRTANLKQLEKRENPVASERVEHILAQTEMLLHEVHHIAREAYHDTEVRIWLRRLPYALPEFHTDEAMVNLVEGFSHFTDQASHEEVRWGLQILVRQLASTAAVEWRSSEEAFTFYRICLDALSVSSLDEIRSNERLLVDKQSGKRSRVKAAALDGVSPWAACKEALVDLGKVALILQELSSVKILQEQESMLTLAIDELQRCEHQALTRYTPPEGLILQCIFEHWHILCKKALQEFREHVILDVTLLTRRVIATAQVTLILQIKNRGHQLARQLHVELVSRPEYAVVIGSCEIEKLLPGEEAELPFVIEPLREQQAQSQSYAQFCLDYEEFERIRLRTLQLPVEFFPIPCWAPFENPYIPGRFLETDSALFFGREPLFAFVEEALSHRHVLVLTGPWRMGKTSLLKQLPSRLRKDYRTVFVDCQGLGDPDLSGFFYKLSREMMQVLQLQPLPRDLFREDPTATFEDRVLPQCFQALEEKQLLIMIDEFEALQLRAQSGRLNPQLFPYLRHLMQHQEQMLFIFAGKHRLEELESEYWASFFNIALHERVGLLETEEARALITQPVSPYLIYEDLALLEALHITAGHPYLLQLLCYILVNEARREQRTYILPEHVSAALPRLLEMGAAYLSDVWKAVSADERRVWFGASHLMSPGGRVTAAEIVAYWEARNLQMKLYQVASALHNLCKYAILVLSDGRAPESEPAYGWLVWVFGHWVEQTRSLTEVLQGTQDL